MRKNNLSQAVRLPIRFPWIFGKNFVKSKREACYANIRNNNDITLRSARLSEKSAYLAEQYIKDAGIAADGIQNSPVHICTLEDRYIDLLKEELLKVNCSGAVILLNTSQTDEDRFKGGSIS